MKKAILLLILTTSFSGCFQQDNSKNVSQISSFEECHNQGYTVSGVYPEKKCIADGKTFVENVSFEKGEIIKPNTINSFYYEYANLTKDGKETGEIGLFLNDINYGPVYQRSLQVSGESFGFVDNYMGLIKNGQYIDNIYYAPAAGQIFYLKNDNLAYFKQSIDGTVTIVKNGKEIAKSHYMDMSDKGDILYTQDSDPIKVYFNEQEIMQMDNCTENDGCEMMMARFSEDGSQIIGDDGQVFYLNDLKNNEEEKGANLTRLNDNNENFEHFHGQEDISFIYPKTGFNILTRKEPGETWHKKLFENEKLLFALYEDGLDSPIIKVLKYAQPLKELKKNQDLYYGLNIDPENSKTESITLHGLSVEKQILPNSKNNCSTYIYLHEVSKNTTGVVMVSLCPSSQSEKELQIVESVRFSDSLD